MSHVSDVASVGGARPDDEHGAGREVPDGADVPWSRLDLRMVWVNLAGLLLSLVPTVVARVFFGVDADSGSFGLWPALVISSIGVTGTVLGLVRWWKTWYRVTDERVELVTGRIVRTYRYVPRERIRTVETGARLRHRLAGLRVLEVGSGETGRAFKLDAVSVREAQRLRRELLRGAPEEEEADTAAGPIAGLRWHWILYNATSVWAPLVGALLLFSAFWTFQVFAVDLREVIRGLWDWEALGAVGSVVVGGLCLHLVGTAFLTLGFMKDRWGFRLERVRTEDGTVLRTREGLLRTREVLREDRRLRGVSVSQPLLGRWMGTTETEVVSTGLAAWTPGTDPPSIIMPRTSAREARRVAGLILQDGVLPLEARLVRHPRAALYRRLGWAVAVAVAVAVAMEFWSARGHWPSAMAAAAAVLVVLAVTAYRSLGHARVGPYVVVRWGLWSRTTAALQARAVAGWRFRQSLVQRLLGLMSVGVLTAAGARHYRAPDMSADDVPGFAGETTPELLADFLVEDATDRPPKREMRK